MRIKLEGITLKGKNRVKEHGQWWDVLDWFHPTDSTACLDYITSYRR